MTGFEYALAGLMIAEGHTEQGEELIRVIRDRYDGEKRNPYNEIECGNNYVRPLASFALINAFSGFDFHLPKGYIKFAPKINQNNFKCIWSLGTGWGEFIKEENKAAFTVIEGSVKLCSFDGAIKNVKEVIIDGKNIEFSENDGLISFEKSEIKESLIIKN
jgi:hypothetical protein